MKAINKAYVIKKSIAKLNFLGYCGSCIQNAKEKTLFYNNINDIEINLRQILSNKSMMQCNDKRKISILKRKAKLKLDYMLFYGSQLPMGKERNKFIQYFGEVNEIIDTITKIKIK